MSKLRNSDKSPNLPTCRAAGEGRLGHLRHLAPAPSPCVRRSPGGPGAPLSPFRPGGPGTPPLPWGPRTPWGPGLPLGPSEPFSPFSPLNPCGPEVPGSPFCRLRPPESMLERVLGPITRPGGPGGPAGPVQPCSPVRGNF